MSFVHLHAHSHFTLLGGLPKVKQLVRHAKAMGNTACALTDHGVMYGIIELIKYCTEEGIKPIAGITINCTFGTYEQYNKLKEPTHHKLVLIAMDNDGYHELIRISTEAMTVGKNEFEHVVEFSFIEKNSGHCICITDGLKYRDQYTPVYIKEKEIESAITSFHTLFGDRLYLELFADEDDKRRDVHNLFLYSFGEKNHISSVVTNNSYYIKKDNALAQDIVLCIGRKCTLNTAGRTKLTGERSQPDSEIMDTKFSNFPKALENVNHIVDRCSISIALDQWKFAKFPIPEGYTYDEFLRKDIFEKGVRVLGRDFTEEEKERIEYEFGIIIQKGYSPYFLIVADFMNWSRDNGIIVTTRGSAAGAFVSYLIGITTVNPLTYNLPFERFLNPFRPSAPDIDADIADYRRDEVIEYVRKKYGHERVAHICTFGTMLARAAVRDAGRVFGLSYGHCDRIAKMIPFGKQGFPVTIASALKESEELRALYAEDEEAASLLDIAQTIEGSARHVSIHAAGVVVSPTSLTDFLPVQYDSLTTKTIITQYEMKSAESAGLLKIDFLGIRNLSILEYAVETIKKRYNISINIYNLPLDDKKTFDLLTAGRTVGVFQMSGDGMTKYIMDLRPTCIEDLMAMVALYRPGPIDSIPEYISRKHGLSPATPIHPDLEQVLEKSYGLLVYQDDVLLTAITLAGYNWLDADKFRKAMGKKIPAEMAKQKEQFYTGCKTHGLSEKEIDGIWERIEPFAAYGFNKAHACSYGMVAYQTAYIKANYPAEFMASVLTNESHDLENVAEAILECRKLNIDVLTPSVNESSSDFTVETRENKNAIRYGLRAIKGLGEHVISVIENEREKNGKYKDLEDFLIRANNKDLNKRSLESLIKSGCLDEFHTRGVLLHNIEKILSFVQTQHDEVRTGQDNLFANQPLIEQFRIKLDPSPDIEVRQKLEWEADLLGLFMSDHPFNDIRKILPPSITSLLKLKEFNGQTIRTSALLSSVKFTITKKGEKIAFARFEDGLTFAEGVIFPSVLTGTEHVWQTNDLYIIDGKVQIDESNENESIAKLIIEKVAPVTRQNILSVIELLPPIEERKWYKKEGRTNHIHEVRPKKHDKINDTDFIKIILPSHVTRDTLKTVKDIIARHPGHMPVYVLLPNKSQLVKTDQTTSYSSDLVKKIELSIGPNTISLISKKQ